MRGIVKVFVVCALGLAVLFASPAVSLAAQKVGGNYCSEGPPEHLPPGKRCPYGSKETNQNKCLDKSCPGCVVVCCIGDADGNITSCGDPVSVGADPRRNVRPDLPATIYQPSTTVPPSRVTPPGGILQKSP